MSSPRQKAIQIFFPPPPTGQTSKGSNLIPLLLANPSTTASCCPHHAAHRHHDGDPFLPVVAADPTVRRLAKHWRLLEASRTALTVLCVSVAFSVLVISAQALHVYHSTRLPPEVHLPLWPSAFNAGPTVALVACSVLMVLAGGLALLSGRYALASHPTIHRSVALAAPSVSFLLALIATGVVYAANSPSSAADTLQSWSCRWSRVSMERAPHFGTLCAQSNAGMYLTVLLVPLQLGLLGVAVGQVLLEKRVGNAVAADADGGGAVGDAEQQRHSAAAVVVEGRRKEENCCAGGCASCRDSSYEMVRVG